MERRGWQPVGTQRPQSFEIKPGKALLNANDRVLVQIESRDQVLDELELDALA
jgi:hypothetical protein